MEWSAVYLTIQNVHNFTKERVRTMDRIPINLSALDEKIQFTQLHGNRNAIDLQLHRIIKSEQRKDEKTGERIIESLGEFN